MKKSADLLCILIMFSIRANFYEKAMRYAECAFALFPEDPRFTELYAYALIQCEDYERAEEVLGKIDNVMPNIALLKGRVGIMLDLPAPEKRSRVSRFLNYWTATP